MRVERPAWLGEEPVAIRRLAAAMATEVRRSSSWRRDRLRASSSRLIWNATCSGCWTWTAVSADFGLAELAVGASRAASLPRLSRDPGSSRTPLSPVGAPSYSRLLEPVARRL